MSSVKPMEKKTIGLNGLPKESEVALSLSPQLLSGLKCTICLNLLKHTMVVKNCLHRFCRDCITTALRKGNKECPICRRIIASHRSLRPDEHFDLLISRIYSSRYEGVNDQQH